VTMVGGFDVHRQQITFDYVDSDGLVRWGQIRPATRKTLRAWLGEHCPDGDGEFALEGCPGWRYISEELAAAGLDVHLGDPAEIAMARGPKKRAKTDRADARLLRTLLLEGRFPESWIPPAHVLEIRTLGRLYCTLMDERRSWQQRIHAQLFHQGCPPIRALLSGAGRAAMASVELSAAGRQYVDTALRRIDELSTEIEPLRTQLVSFARRQHGCQALQRQYGIGWLCAAIMGPRSVMPAGLPVRISWCGLPGWMSPCIPPTPSAHRGTCRGRARRNSAGRRLRRPNAPRGVVPRITPTTKAGRQTRWPQRQEPYVGGGAQNPAPLLLKMFR
jgi:transposase